MGKGLELPHPSLQLIYRVDFLWDWLVWSPCCPRDSRESSPAPHFESVNSSVLSHLYDPTFTSVHDYWNITFEKYPNMGGPVRFKPSLFKGQVYSELSNHHHQQNIFITQRKPRICSSPPPPPAPITRPWQTLTSFLSIFTALFWTFHMNGIIQYVTFWHLTLSVVFTELFFVFFFCIFSFFFYIWLMIIKYFIESSFLLSLIIIKYFLGSFFSFCNFRELSSVWVKMCRFFFLEKHLPDASCVGPCGRWWHHMGPCARRL